MTISIANITSGRALTSSDDGKFLDVDATAGDLILSLPAANTLPVGWHVPVIMKSDPTSNLVQFKTTQSGDKLNWFWDMTSPFGPYLNLSQQAAELVCDGVSRYHLLGKTFHRGQPQSQRTVITPNYNVLPKDVGEVIRCDATQAGGGIGLYFNPVSHFTHGGYLSNVIEVQKVDAGPGTVTVFPFAGDAMDAVVNKTFTLTKQFETVKFYISSDGLWVHRHYKP